MKEIGILTTTKELYDLGEVQAPCIPAVIHIVILTAIVYTCCIWT